jgi:site-specific recombinase XerD
MQHEVDNSDIKASTKKTRDSYVRRFREYSPNATLAEANTIDYVNGFINHEKKKGNNENTIQKGLSILRAYLYKALDKELIAKVVSIKVKAIEGNREYLDEDEIRSLIELYKKNTLSERLQKILQYFLFGCFSGLRYGDISTLKYSNIKGNFLEFIMEKTNRNHAIPVMDEFAKSLISPKENKLDDSLVFDMPTNQKYNAFLKEVMTIAEIDKNITTHSARHTFATLSLSAGVPIEVVSKLLGHKDIKTTMIYAKVLPQLKIQGMEKLSALINAA